MAKKQKLTQEEKVAIVHRCLSGEIGVVEAGRIAGVAHKTIRRWIIQYEIEEDRAFGGRKNINVYSPERKEQAVWSSLMGTTVSASEKSMPGHSKPWCSLFEDLLETKQRTLDTQKGRRNLDK